jgi:hypothetical protein
VTLPLLTLPLPLWKCAFCVILTINTLFFHDFYAKTCVCRHFDTLNVPKYAKMAAKMTLFVPLATAIFCQF